MDQSTLDRPDVLQILFHPRRGFSSRASSSDVYPVSVEVEPGISISGWLYSAGDQAPVILYFHGNGEIASDYDDLARFYTERGITLLAMDFRGYGLSDGSPTGTTLLTDAVAIFEATDAIFAAHGFQPDRLYVMGRSLGSASAIEIAHHFGDELAGLIVESGFADTFELVARLGGPAIKVDDAEAGFGNAAKIAEITIPTLVIHGDADVLIPPGDGQTLYDRSPAENKRLVMIADAGHNNLMLVGIDHYFGAIKTFVSSTQ